MYVQGPLSGLWRRVPGDYSNYVIGGILTLAVLMLLIAKLTSRLVIPTAISASVALSQGICLEKGKYEAGILFSMVKSYH